MSPKRIHKISEDCLDAPPLPFPVVLLMSNFRNKQTSAKLKIG